MTISPHIIPSSIRFKTSGMCVDLHIHSLYSDGSHTPEELITLAARNRLQGLALTDHDTIEGVEEFTRLGSQAGIITLTGVEISTNMYQRAVHILGYGIDINNAELKLWLRPLQEGRKQRNTIILQKLRDLGIVIREEEVQRVSGGGQIGRPHIARLLIEKGVVDSFEAAFKRYLGRNRPAWEDRFSYTPAATIDMIHRMGGVAVLAHPGHLDPEMRLQPSLIQELARYGLDGVEIYYPTHTKKMRKKLKAIAAHHGLLLTGGSDFHGSTRPTHPLAGGKEGFCPPLAMFETLLTRLRRNSQSSFSC
ncbi:MAG: PHP domain-containing protein [Desulfobulbus sp.]|nr:PHP domain-containing protein [Desulfobulbus sp.]